jgi:hypothetical protein
LVLHLARGAFAEKFGPYSLPKFQKKNFTVQRALQNNFWIAQVCPLTTEKEIKEYADLWEEIQLTHRDTESDDQITWRWTQTGEYTTKSAYQIQF